MIEENERKNITNEKKIIKSKGLRYEEILNHISMVSY